jgi:hypothetical protein
LRITFQVDDNGGERHGYIERLNYGNVGAVIHPTSNFEETYANVREILGYGAEDAELVARERKEGAR